MRPDENAGVSESKSRRAAQREDREPLWEFASARGIDRRQFLRLMLAGGATAVLAACVGTEPSGSRAQPAPTPLDDESAGFSSFFKDPAPFIQRDTKGLEARLEYMQGTITPNRLFFVRNNGPASLDLDASRWRLAVEGDAIAEPTVLTYDDIRGLPSHSLISYLECAGNHRAMFNLLNGQETDGAQWMTGAVGDGEWLGVRLADVLALAGIRDDAVSVLLVGLDTESPEGGFRYVLPVEKAMHPETLLAYALNGETLPKDHGFPLRAVVPGWVGKRAHQVAWAHRRFFRADVDAEQHDVLHAHWRRVPAGGRVGGQAGDGAGNQERVGTAMAGGTRGGT